MTKTYITLKWNRQYLPDVEGIYEDESAEEWARLAAQAVNRRTAAIVEDVVEDRDLHELWTYTARRMDATTADDIQAEIEHVTENGDWQVLLPGYAPENPARARW